MINVRNVLVGLKKIRSCLKNFGFNDKREFRVIEKRYFNSGRGEVGFYCFKEWVVYEEMGAGYIGYFLMIGVVKKENVMRWYFEGMFLLRDVTGLRVYFICKLVS